MAEAQAKSPQVFVSYAREDSGQVYPEADWLRSLGYQIHIDRHITPGVQWREAVADALASSQVLLFYLSPASVASRYCAQEVQFALTRDIPVVTVLLAQTPLPGWMELTLGDHQQLLRFELGPREYRRLLVAGLNRQMGGQAPGVQALTPPEAAPRRRWAWPLEAAAAVALVIALAALTWRLLPQGAASIAVLPFDAEATPAGASLAAGVSSALSQGLVSLDLLPVRSALPSAAGERPAPPAGVAYLLIGNVQNRDNGFRVRTALVEAAGRREVWGQTWMYLDPDPIAVQRQHVRQVLRALPDVLAGTVPALDHTTREGRNSAARLAEQGAQVLADSHDQSGLARARRLYEQSLDDRPGYGTALLGLCNVLLGEYEGSKAVDVLVEAETRCLQALAVGAEPVSTHLALGRVFLARDEAAIARTHFQRAASLRPGEPEAWVGLGAVADAAGDDALALEYYEKAVALPDAGWPAHIALGNYQFAHGAFTEAASQYQKVIELYPESALAHTNLGAVWYNLGEFEQAVGAWERVLELEPNAYAWANLGAARTYLRDYAGAAEAFRRAAAEAPDDHRWWGHLGEVIVHDPTADAAAGRETLERALRLALSQLEYTPPDAATLARISTYEALLGRADAARERADGVRAGGPADLQAVYSLLQTYTALGDRQTAGAQRERLLSLGYPAELLERDPWLGD